MRTTCSRCGSPLPPLAMKEGDPYCSCRCCKQAHGVEDSFPTGSAAQSEAARRTGRMRRLAVRQQKGVVIPKAAAMRELVAVGG